jgi:soluble lytic murein transglycosylase-like protein
VKHQGLISPLLLTLILIAARTAPAAPLRDPFLERFRVGFGPEIPRISLPDGWPAELFLPCRVDSLWRASLDSTLTLLATPGAGLINNDLLDAALGGPAERGAWAARERIAAQALGSGRNVVAPATADESEESLQWTILNNYHLKNYGTATVQAERLLTAPGQPPLPDDARFIWSLRWRRLRELATSRPDTAGEVPWPELYALGSYDSNSGWALWSARQRARARPLLPAGCGEEALALFLLRLTSAGVTTADLDRAGFPPEARAAVGAACLPRGPELAHHFARHPVPPTHPRFQDAWLRGRLRSDGWEPSRAETWAAHPGIQASGQVRLWRRAAEERALAGAWAPALADLERAFVAARGDPALRVPVAIQAQQVALLAAVLKQGPAAARIRELARAELPAGEWDSWRDALAPAWARLGLGAPPDTTDREGILATARRRVQAGLSAPLDRAAPTAGATLWPAAALAWEAWLAWGGRLANTLAGGLADARATEYRDALAAAAAAATPATREALARAAVGRFLHGHPDGPAAVRWLLERERLRIAGPDAAPAGPPLPPGAADARAWPDRHVLLGLALAAGDPHACVVLARGLPASGLPERDRLRLLYPVPGVGALREELSALALDPALILALARNESLFDPGVRSRAGALGWLQIMPFHYPERGAPAGEAVWRRPVMSLRTGARLLLENARAFDGDPYRATAGYNAGGEAVRRWVRQLGGRSEPVLFLPWIGYAETRSYVEKVLIDREIYGWIISGALSGAP